MVHSNPSSISMTKILISILLLLAGLSPCAGAAEAKLDIAGAWIKHLPPVMQVRAGYVRIRNPGTQAIALVGADSADFGRVEMHETLLADGTMKMVKSRRFEVPPGGELRLEPGGRHLMLIKPTRDLAVGDTAVIDLHFDNGLSYPVAFVIRP